jgi:hypothetical protein
MQMEDNETPPHEDFKHSTSRHVRARAREMNSSADARLSGSPSVDLTGVDARTLSREDYLNLVDRFRNGRRGGLRSTEVGRQLREARNEAARRAFELGLKNRSE